jgi:hypothetical protein
MLWGVLWLKPSGEMAEIGFGDGLDLPFGVNAEVFCLSFNQALPGPFADNLISEADRTPPQGLEGGPHRDQLVVPRRPAVFARCLSNHQAVALFFQFKVIKTPLATIFRSAHFKPDEVIGVVDHPHAVGLRIADSQVKLYTIVIPHLLTAHLIPSP